MATSTTPWVIDTLAKTPPRVALVSRKNEARGYRSEGWRTRLHTQRTRNKLRMRLLPLTATRVDAVLAAHRGNLLGPEINLAQDVLIPYAALTSNLLFYNDDDDAFMMLMNSLVEYVHDVQTLMFSETDDITGLLLRLSFGGRLAQSVTDAQKKRVVSALLDNTGADAAIREAFLRDASKEMSKTLVRALLRANDMIVHMPDVRVTCFAIEVMHYVLSRRAKYHQRVYPVNELGAQAFCRGDDPKQDATVNPSVVFSITRTMRLEEKTEPPVLHPTMLQLARTARYGVTENIKLLDFGTGVYGTVEATVFNVLVRSDAPDVFARSKIMLQLEATFEDTRQIVKLEAPVRPTKDRNYGECIVIGAKNYTLRVLPPRNKGIAAVVMTAFSRAAESEN